MKHKTKHPRYCIPWSSWFDHAPFYQKEKIARIVKENGGKIVRFRNQFDWANQPKIVTFTCNIETIPVIENALRKEFDTEWIHINNVLNWTRNQPE